MFSPPSLQALPHPKCDLEDITLGINRYFLMHPGSDS